MTPKIAPPRTRSRSEHGQGYREAPKRRGIHAIAAAVSMARTLALSVAVSVALLCGPLDDALAESGGGSEGGGGSGEMDRMVALTPMPITIIHQGKIRGIMVIEIYLEAHDFDEVERINQFLPRLLDAYRTGLSEFAAHEVRLDRLINLERLELYINRESRAVLGDNGIHVIFKQVMVQTR